MHIIEPQECVQWEIRSRQTSDSSSSGVGNNYTILYLRSRLWVNGISTTVADASSESTDSSEVSEVVTGVEETTFSTDASNGDGNRGGKVCPRCVVCSVDTTCCEYFVVGFDAKFICKW